MHGEYRRHGGNDVAALVDRAHCLDPVSAGMVMDEFSGTAKFKAFDPRVANVILALMAIRVAAVLGHVILLEGGILARRLPRFAGSLARVAGLATIAIALVLLGPEQARAMEWGINPQKSMVGFETSVGGTITKGTFGQFRSEIEFDPDTPDETAVRVSLNMQSATTGTPDVDTTLQGVDCFNSAKYPTAEFAARGAKASGAGKYILTGQLTLKGVTKPVSVPFTIEIKSGTATVKAEAKINRLDFGVGQQTVAGLAMDQEVKLTINLTAVRLDN
jgi:polyisoprenoid-binding protein YceI